MSTTLAQHSLSNLKHVDLTDTVSASVVCAIFFDGVIREVTWLRCMVDLVILDLVGREMISSGIPSDQKVTLVAESIARNSLRRINETASSCPSLKGLRARSGTITVSIFSTDAQDSSRSSGTARVCLDE
jgi:hypothetical protein